MFHGLEFFTQLDLSAKESHKTNNEAVMFISHVASQSNMGWF